MAAGADAIEEASCLRVLREEETTDADGTASVRASWLEGLNEEATANADMSASEQAGWSEGLNEEATANADTEAGVPTRWLEDLREEARAVRSSVDPETLKAICEEGLREPGSMQRQIAFLRILSCGSDTDTSADESARPLGLLCKDAVAGGLACCGEFLGRARRQGNKRCQVFLLHKLGTAAGFLRLPSALELHRMAAGLVGSAVGSDEKELIARVLAPTRGCYTEDLSRACASFKQACALAWQQYRGDGKDGTAECNSSPVVAARGAEGKITRAQVQIVSAVSGNMILGPTAWTRSHLDVHTLSRMAGVDLRAYKVVQGAQAVPLHGLRLADLDDGLCKVLRRPCRDYLINTWRPSGEARSGWRKWYKEFIQFSAQVLPLRSGEAAPGWLRGDGLEHPYCLGRAPVRSLVPCILQAKAWDLRQDQADSDWYWSATRESFLRRRPWEGAVHAIVLRSCAPCRVIRQWVRSWCAENAEILEAIEEAIERAGPQCYFP